MDQYLINITKGNTYPFTIDVSVPFSLDDYEGVFTMKEDYDGDTLVSQIGTLDGSRYSFELSYSDTSVGTGDYPFDITIDSSSKRYTIKQGVVRIGDSVRF